MRRPKCWLGALALFAACGVGDAPMGEDAAPLTSRDAPPIHPLGDAFGALPSVGGCMTVPAHLVARGIPPVSLWPETVLYLERRGGTFVPGTDDAAAGVSSVLSTLGHAAVTVPPFRGSDGDWAALVACMRDEYSRFGVDVTDVRPTRGHYTEVVFGGGPALLGLPPSTGGISPIDTIACHTIPDAVVFIFSDNFGGNVEGACEIGAHEAAHTFGLDHELLAADPMSYLTFLHHRVFQDQPATCGEYQPRPCLCGRPSQDSVQLLRQRLGGPSPR